MILTCPQCQSQYNVDPALLGASGREVRCVSCGHMWFQQPSSEAAPVAAEAAPPQQAAPPSPPPQQQAADPAPVPPPAAAPPPSPVQEAQAQPAKNQSIDEIIKQDDAVFEAILTSVSSAAKAADSQAAAAVPQEEKKAPPVVPALPIVTHKPFGVNEGAFGALVFFFLFFASLTVLFAAKGQIVRHWPQMALFYKTLKLDIKAPGEGLRFDEVTAEWQSGDGGKTLVVAGKITNMTNADMPYPSLSAVLKNAQGGEIKSWDVRPGGPVKAIAAATETPVMLQLAGAPEGGVSVELRVHE